MGLGEKGHPASSTKDWTVFFKGLYMWRFSHVSSVYISSLLPQASVAINVSSHYLDLCDISSNFVDKSGVDCTKVRWIRQRAVELLMTATSVFSLNEYTSVGAFLLFTFHIYINKTVCEPRHRWWVSGIIVRLCPDINQTSTHSPQGFTVFTHFCELFSESKFQSIWYLWLLQVLAWVSLIYI